MPRKVKLLVLGLILCIVGEAIGLVYASSSPTTVPLGAAATTTTQAAGKRVCAFTSPVILIASGQSRYSFSSALGRTTLGGDVTYSTGLTVTGADFVSGKFPTVEVNNGGPPKTGWYELYYFC